MIDVDRLEWKPYLDQYEVTSCGLMRRRVSKTGNPAGKMISPSRPKVGKVIYHIRDNGRKRLRSVHFITKQVWGVGVDVDNNWSKKIREFVAEHNMKLLGHVPRQKEPETFSSAMWNHADFDDPWLTYRVTWCSEHVTQTQLYPLG